jgi:hypothetical protein
VFDVLFAAPWGALSQLEDPLISTITSTTTATTSTSSLSLHQLTDLVLIADGTYGSARSYRTADTSYSSSNSNSSSSSSSSRIDNRCFLLSGAATVGLLDKLLCAAAHRSDACNALQRRISAAVAGAHSAGTASGYRFCVCYAAAVEAHNSSSSNSSAASAYTISSPATVQQLVTRIQSLDNSVNQTRDHSVMEGLQAVAQSRVLLTQAAAAVCTALESTDAGAATNAATNAATEQAQALLTAVAPLLTLPPIPTTVTSTTQQQQQQATARVRAARLYFLRHLERGRGLTFVRGALRAPLLARHQWLHKWGDSSLLRFLGDSRLPQACFARAVPGFAQAVQTVAAVSRGDAASSDTPVPSASGLVCALFAEVALLRALDAGARGAQFDSGVQRLQQWLTTSCTAAASSAFAEQQLVSSMLCTSRVQSVLTLTPASPPDAILRAQVAAHLAAAALCEATDSGSANASSGALQLFTELLLRPEALAGCFLPVMPADSGMEMVRTALGLAYYTCPCGYRYGIGECGQPMETSTCPQCKAQIGGSGHVPAAGNAPAAARAEDSVQRGYCYSLHSTADDSPAPVEGVRALRLPQLLAVRCLLHCALSVAAAAAGGAASSNWCAELVRALHPPAAAGSSDSSGGSAALTAERITAVCAERAGRDWQALRTALHLSSDDVAAALHMAILAACNSTATTAAAAAAVAGQPLAQQLSTDAGRGAWEQRFVQQCLHNSVIVDNTAAAQQELAAATACYSDDGQDAVAADILRSDDTSSGYSTADTGSSSDISSSSSDGYSGLWAHRTSFTFTAFVQAFEARANTTATSSSSSTTDRAYPLLAAVLQRKSSLPALQALPLALQWVTRICAHYAHKLSRSAAQELTVRDTLVQLDSNTSSDSNSNTNSSDSSSAAAAAAAFAGFATAWNTAWKDVQQFGCLQVPAQYADVVMTRDTLLCFCLPGDRDEGICCLALLQAT